MPRQPKPVAERTPTPGRPRPLQYKVYLSVEEASTLHEAAQQMGITPSALIVLMVRNAKGLTVSVPPLVH